MNLIFKEKPDGTLGITRFAFWGTIILILAAIYFGCGGFVGHLQQGSPPGAH